MVGQISQKKRTIRSPQQWQELFQEWQNSGLSKNVYCRTHDLSNSLFGKWQRKLGFIKPAEARQPTSVPFERGSASSFIPVHIEREETKVDPLKQLDLVLVSGHRLCFQGGWTGEELACLLKPMWLTS